MTWNGAMRLTALAMAGLLVAACAGTQHKNEDRAERAQGYLEQGEDDAGADQDGPLEELPDPLEAQLSEPPLLDPLELHAEDPRFDISAHEVPAAEFFHGLVEDTPYNVVVHPEVEGAISLSLNDVSVPEVMETLREGYGYEYQRTQTAYLVLPARLESRLFHLDYLNVDRSGEAGTRVSAGEIAAEETGDGALGSWVDTLFRSDVWTDLQEIIDRIIADETDQGASAVVSPQAGTVAVRATPGTLNQVGEFMDRLQDTVNRQVILEARVIEVELYDEYESGIDWQSVGGTDFDMTGPDGVFDSVFTLDIGSTVDDFTATINALDRQGDVQVLSAPRVSTVNNQQAIIKVGTDAYYQTDVSLDTQVVDDSRFVTVDPDFEPFFSGISLSVTPNINQDDWMSLHVQPSVTSVEDVERSLQIEDGQRAEFRLAQSDVRQSDSVVRARDGEMVVIGGMIEERERSVDSGVPVLGRIPLLGWLFSYERLESSKFELVILLRPRVVRDADWSGQIQEQSQRLEQLYRDDW